MSPFTKKIIEIIRLVPFGHVVSYSQVAAYVGVPRAARQVGWTLIRLEGVDLPWWRVVNNTGRITIKGNRYITPEVQRRFLCEEGIEVADDFTFDIERYRFTLSLKELQKMNFDDDYITMLHHKYFSLR